MVTTTVWISPTRSTAPVTARVWWNAEMDNASPAHFNVMATRTARMGVMRRTAVAVRLHVKKETEDASTLPALIHVVVALSVTRTTV